MHACTLLVFFEPFYGLFFNSLDKSICDIRDVWLVLWLIIEIPVFNSNNVDPDQTPQFLKSWNFRM